ncbi:MAG: hypothetical protein ACRYFZ_27075 [Janthinobacterium lividum]
MRILIRLLAFSLVLSLAATGPTGAQAFYYVPAPETTAAFASGTSYVARVVDARPQRASLGLVVRGSKERAAIFQEGVATTLQTFFRTHAPGHAGALPLVMRLSGLEIAEMPGSFVEGRWAETATAGLVADFYAPQPDSSYQLVLRFANTHQEIAFDATGQHAGNLGNLLLEAAALGSQPATWLASGPRYPKTLVLAPQPLPNETLPVLAPAMQPRAGFYTSLTDFWLNQPSEPGQPIVEQQPYANPEWAGVMEIKAYRNKAGHRVLATDAWGFCDGQDFYVRRGRSFYKLERRGPDFLFFGSASEDPVYRKASSDRAGGNAALLGGALGGALVGAADAAAAGGPLRLLKLSLLTGEVRLAQSNSVAAAVVANRPTHLFIYRPRSEKGPAVRISLAEGQPTQELAAGDFLTFEPSSDQALRVCLLPTTGPATYLAVTPTAEAPTYLECRPTGPEPLRKVTDATGAAALSKLVR